MQACQLGLSRPIAICNFLNLLTLVKKFAAGLFKDDRLTVFEFFFPTFILVTVTLFTTNQLNHNPKIFQLYYKIFSVICSDRDSYDILVLLGEFVLPLQIRTSFDGIAGLALAILAGKLLRSELPASQRF